MIHTNEGLRRNACAVCGGYVTLTRGEIRVVGRHAVRRVRRKSGKVVEEYISKRPEDLTCAGSGFPPAPLILYRPSDPDEVIETRYRTALGNTGSVGVIGMATVAT